MKKLILEIVLTLLMIMAAILIVLAISADLTGCGSEKSLTPNNPGQVDTVYVGPVLEIGEYYRLSSAGINGVDTLASMRLMHIDCCDTCAGGWRAILFSASPDSAVNNAQDIIITHITPQGDPISTTKGEYFQTLERGGQGNQGITTGK